MENLRYLSLQDQVKFVICDRADYEWAKQTVATHDLTARCEILFSPATTSSPPAISPTGSSPTA
jgi:7-carboxy-7-deazaguanine synthase